MAIEPTIALANVGIGDIVYMPLRNLYRTGSKVSDSRYYVGLNSHASRVQHFATDVGLKRDTDRWYAWSSVDASTVFDNARDLDVYNGTFMRVYWTTPTTAQPMFSAVVDRLKAVITTPLGRRLTIPEKNGKLVLEGV